MEPEDRDLLERTFKLARDNNLILRGMSRAALFNNLFRIIAWILVLGGSIWLYSAYLGPALGSFTSKVDQAQGVSQGASDQFKAFSDMLKKLQETLPSYGSATNSPEN